MFDIYQVGMRKDPSLLQAFNVDWRESLQDAFQAFDKKMLTQAVLQYGKKYQYELASLYEAQKQLAEYPQKLLQATLQKRGFIYFLQIEENIVFDLNKAKHRLINQIVSDEWQAADFSSYVTQATDGASLEVILTDIKLRASQVNKVVNVSGNALAYFIATPAGWQLKYVAATTAVLKKRLRGQVVDFAEFAQSIPHQTEKRIWLTERSMPLVAEETLSVLAENADAYPDNQGFFKQYKQQHAKYLAAFDLESGEGDAARLQHALILAHCDLILDFNRWLSQQPDNAVVQRKTFILTNQDCSQVIKKIQTDFELQAKQALQSTTQLRLDKFRPDYDRSVGVNNAWVFFQGKEQIDTTALFPEELFSRLKYTNAIKKCIVLLMNQRNFNWLFTEAVEQVFCSQLENSIRFNFSDRQACVTFLTDTQFEIACRFETFLLPRKTETAMFGSTQWCPLRENLAPISINVTLKVDCADYANPKIDIALQLATTFVTRGMERLLGYPKPFGEEIDKHPQRQAILGAIGEHSLPIDEAVLATILEKFSVTPQEQQAFTALSELLGKTRAHKLIEICRTAGLKKLAGQLHDLLPVLGKILQQQVLSENIVQDKAADLINLLASLETVDNASQTVQEFLQKLVDHTTDVTRCILADSDVIIQEAKELVLRNEHARKLRMLDEQQLLGGKLAQPTAPLFWRWLKIQTNVHLYEQVKQYTTFWTEEDWYRHIPTFFECDNWQLCLTQLQQDPSQLKIFNAIPDLLPEEFLLLRGEARLIKWLETSPQLVVFLKKTDLVVESPIFRNETLWEALASIVGENSDQRIAKTQLETWLKQLRAQVPITAADLVSGILAQRKLAASTWPDKEVLQRLPIELCLAKFAELNPAFIRWFKKDTLLWNKLIDSFKNLSITLLEKLLLNISYILMQGDKNHLSLFRSLFNKPLDQVVSALPLSATYTKFFLSEIRFDQPLLQDVSDETLALALPDSELQLMMNGSRTAIGLSILTNPTSDSDSKKQAKRLLVTARQLETDTVSPVLHTLRLQETRDVALIQNVGILAKDSLAFMQNLQSTDAAKLTVAMHTKTALEVSRHSVANTLKLLEEHLATSQIIEQQITHIDQNIQDTMQSVSVREQKAQQTFLRQTVRYEKYISQLDEAVFQCNEVIKQAAPRLLVKQKHKTALYTKPNEKIIIESKTKPIIEMIQMAQDALSANNIDANNVPVQELKQNQRYMQATSILGADQPLILSVETEVTANGRQAFVSTLHKMPTMPKMLDALFCWFKGVKTPFATALEQWIDKQFELARHSDLPTIYIDCAEVKILEAALCMAYVKNFIRQYNGEPEILINYSDRWKLNIADIVDEAKNKVKALINIQHSMSIQQAKAESITTEIKHREKVPQVFHSNNRVAR